MQVRAAALVAASEAALSGRSLWQDALRRLFQNTAAVTAMGILAAIVVLVTVGPLLSPYGGNDTVEAIQGPGIASGHYFGTDLDRRDLFVRTLEGGRVSLMIGIVATLVSLLIGVTYGAVAGYFGGMVDEVMMRIVDILYAMPFIFFVILLMVIFGRDIVLIFIAIGAINWLDMARIVRGQTLSLRNKEFIEAAQATGVAAPTIIRRHIVPNLLGIVAVYVTLTVPQVILVESFLSFLGLGVQEPATSWGVLVNEGAVVIDVYPWMLIFPAAFLAVTLFCLNFIGDGLRDALDPKDR